MNKNIMKLKEKLTQIGPFHPGKITKQLVKCGKKNCKCQDTQNPQKHGPYSVFYAQLCQRKKEFQFIPRTKTFWDF